MMTKYFLEKLDDFFKYEYESCIKQRTFFDSIEVYHSTEGFCLKFNHQKDVLSFDDGKGNQWIYTENDDFHYDCNAYNFRVVFLSGHTLYDNGNIIKRTHTEAEVLYRAAIYFSQFIKEDVCIFTTKRDHLYKIFPKEFFSPLSHIKYSSPIIFLLDEPEDPFGVFGIKIANKTTNACFSESCNFEKPICFTDDEGNSWMHNENGGISFIKHSDNGEETLRLTPGDKMYYQEYDIYYTFTHSKEEVYERAMNYFSKYTEDCGLIQFELNVNQLPQN